MEKNTAQTKVKESYKIDQKTTVAKIGDLNKKWVIIDAKGLKMGRLASAIADKLRGKDKPIFTPAVDCGDNIIVINAKDVVLTGQKENQKVYYHHSLFPGGLKRRSFGQLTAKDETKPLYIAVRGMLPKTKLSRAQLNNLKIYDGEAHPHQAQKPEKWEL